MLLDSIQMWPNVFRKCEIMQKFLLKIHRVGLLIVVDYVSNSGVARIFKKGREGGHSLHIVSKRIFSTENKFKAD